MVSPADIYTHLSVQFTEVQTRALELASALPDGSGEARLFQARSPQAIDLPALQPVTSNPFARAVATFAVSFAEAQGRRCQLFGRPMSPLQYNTLYVFPILELELHSPDGEKKPIEVNIPPFRTFGEGNAAVHVQEYASVHMDIDLQASGFRVWRKDTQILFEAMPGREGWNISVREMTQMPVPPQARACDMGLRVGMSSHDAGQQAGTLGESWYGRYEINGHTVDLRVLHAQRPTVARVGETLAGLINKLTPETQVRALIDTENRLVLQQTEPGPDHSFSVKRLPDPPDIEHLDYQDPGLPEGEFVGKELEIPQIPQLQLGVFRLNGIPCDLGAVAVQNAATAREEIEARLRELAPRTRARLTLDEQGYLCLEGARLILEPQSESPWGLEPLALEPESSDWHEVRAAIERWLEHVNRALSLVSQNPPLKPVEQPLRQALLSQLPGQSGFQVTLVSGSGLQLAFRHDILMQSYDQTVTALRAYYRQLATQIEHLGQQLENLRGGGSLVAKPVATPTPPPVAAPPPAAVLPEQPDLTPAAPLRHVPTQNASFNTRLQGVVPSQEKEEKEAPRSSFDHKI